MRKEEDQKTKKRKKEKKREGEVMVNEEEEEEEKMLTIGDEYIQVPFHNLSGRIEEKQIYYPYSLPLKH